MLHRSTAGSGTKTLFNSVRKLRERPLDPKIRAGVWIISRSVADRNPARDEAESGSFLNRMMV
jgi:hypothetical protein